MYKHTAPLNKVQYLAHQAIQQLNKGAEQGINKLKREKGQQYQNKKQEPQHLAISQHNLSLLSFGEQQTLKDYTCITEWLPLFTWKCSFPAIEALLLIFGKSLKFCVNVILLTVLPVSKVSL